nr:hypothetical protein [Clostridium sp. MCC353]
MRHMNEYPQMEVQDAVKLLYQSEFGGGHMIKEEALSLERLRAEFGEGRKRYPHPGEAGEPVGGGLMRMDLDVLNRGLSPETLNRMFVLTAAETSGSAGSFEGKLEALRACVKEGSTPFNIKELDDYLKRYRAEGYPAVSHSRRYRDAYEPSYRIVKEEYGVYFQVFRDIDLLLKKTDKSPLLAAIDGKSGSGKSTLAALIQEVYGCGLFHMDDFFLQPHQRTEERFAQAGGNVDYERFYEEVLVPVLAGKDFCYRRYDCCSRKLAETIEVKASRLNIIEGVYSQHPYFGDIYDLKYFMTVSEEEQRSRILKRNGEVMLERFLKEWIPLENIYFEKCGIGGTIINV